MRRFMDCLTEILQQIMDISNECLDLQTQRRLDELYDSIVYGPLQSMRKQIDFGIPIDPVSGWVPL